MSRVARCLLLARRENRRGGGDMREEGDAWLPCAGLFKWLLYTNKPFATMAAQSTDEGRRGL